MDPVQLHSLQNCQSIWLGFGGVFLGVELAVFLGVDLGVFLGVFLCVDLSSAVGVLVTSSQIGPFNAPCYRPNIPTCDFAQNTSQKHPRRNNTNQKRHWLQPLWASYIQPAGRWSEICKISVGLVPKSNWLGPCLPVWGRTEADGGSSPVQILSSTIGLPGTR